VSGIIALLMTAAIHEIWEGIIDIGLPFPIPRNAENVCTLIRKEHSGVIHPDRHYWDCVYLCPGFPREYILPGTTSVLLSAP